MWNTPQKMLCHRGIRNFPKQKCLRGGKLRVLKYLNVCSLHICPHCKWTVVEHAVGIRAPMSECTVLAFPFLWMCRVEPCLLLHFGLLLNSVNLSKLVRSSCPPSTQPHAHIAVSQAFAGTGIHIKHAQNELSLQTKRTYQMFGLY